VSVAAAERILQVGELVAPTVLAKVAVSPPHSPPTNRARAAKRPSAWVLAGFSCLADRFSRGRPGLELTNVVAKIPLKGRTDFRPNSGCRDYSRLSCDGGSVARA